MSKDAHGGDQEWAYEIVSQIRMSDLGERRVGGGGDWKVLERHCLVLGIALWALFSLCPFSPHFSWTALPSTLDFLFLVAFSCLCLFCSWFPQKCSPWSFVDPILAVSSPDTISQLLLPLDSLLIPQFAFLGENCVWLHTNLVDQREWYLGVPAVSYQKRWWVWWGPGLTSVVGIELKKGKNMHVYPQGAPTWKNRSGPYE